MSRPSKRTSVLLEAIELAKKPLAHVAEGTERAELLREAEECARIVHLWAAEAPTGEQRDAMMQRVLRMHLTVARLCRGRR
jgi:hypothetical protein